MRKLENLRAFFENDGVDPDDDPVVPLERKVSATGPEVPPTPSRLPHLEALVPPLSRVGERELPLDLHSDPIPASELVRKPSPTGAAPATAAKAGVRFGVSIIAGPSRGQRYRLPTTGAVVGRTRGAILFPDDLHVSGLHASLIVRDGVLHVRDEGSTSGVFIAIGAPEPLPERGYFSAGNRLFRYAGVLVAPPGFASGRVLSFGAQLTPGQPTYAIEEIMLGGRTGRSILGSGPALTIGQTRCDFSFPAEPSLAPKHCEVVPQKSGALLKDTSSGLGTFLRLLPGVERPLGSGDRLRIGQQILQVAFLTA